MRPATARSAVRPPWAHAALSHPCFTGISRQHLGELVTELADPWTASHEAALQQRRGHRRRRAAGAGPNSGWRSATASWSPWSTCACNYLTRPWRCCLRGPLHRHPHHRRGPVTPGPAGLRGPRPAKSAAADAGRRGRLRQRLRGGVAPGRHRDPGPPPPRPPTRPAGVRVGQAQAEHHQAHRHQRRAGSHAVEWGGAAWPHARPHRCQDRGHLGPAPNSILGSRSGSTRATGGLATAFPEQVTAPPRKPPKDAAAEVVDAYRQARTRQSSQRICVEHAIAEHKKWRTLQRYLGRREHFGETYLAVAGLISDGPLDADRASAGPVSPTRPAPYRAPSLRPSHRPGACWHTRASMTRQIPSSNA
jgi:hypothetical protein